LINQAEIHIMASSKRIVDRREAASTLVSAFALLPDKVQAWDDLIELTRDWEFSLRWMAANALGLVFRYVPDKQLAWKDLHELIHDCYVKDDSKIFELVDYAKPQAILSLGYAFQYFPDKRQAWKDLHDSVYTDEDNVRSCAAKALGSAFQYIPDKQLAWEDLIWLSGDEVSHVRMYAYHSLGRISIYKTLESKEMDAIRSELEAAVEFFERSSREIMFYSNPASFCRPFYRSYLALTFQGASDAEVQKYLAEAKEAVGSSENKKELFGAVENLAKALEETQKLKEKSKEHIQSDLQAYRWYFERAAEHMVAVEEKAPDAVGLLRKCNPIIEERIEATIAGIQKTAREICQVTHGSGTKYEAPSAQIDRYAKSLSSDDPLELFKACSSIASSAKEFCRLLPQDKRGRGCEIVDEIEAEQEIPAKILKIDRALIYLQPNIEMAALESAINSKLNDLDKKLNIIILDLSKIKIGSGNIFSNLCAVRTELNKIAEVEKSSVLDCRSVSTHSGPPNENQIELGKLIETKVLELEEVLKTKATKEDIQAILKEMENLKHSLKPSAGFEWLGRIADVIAVFDASIKVFAFLM